MGTLRARRCIATIVAASRDLPAVGVALPVVRSMIATGPPPTGRAPELEQEPVELGLGQRIGALHLERVLRREHEERRLERVALAGDRHLLLLHRLEQRRLGLGRGAVDLVGEHDVREDRAGLEPEDALAALLDEDVGADDVRGHQVGRELDAVEGAVDDVRERAHEHRLAQARHALQQRVGVGEQADQACRTIAWPTMTLPISASIALARWANASGASRQPRRAAPAARLLVRPGSSGYTVPLWRAPR